MKFEATLVNNLIWDLEPIDLGSNCDSAVFYLCEHGELFLWDYFFICKYKVNNNHKTELF